MYGPCFLSHVVQQRSARQKHALSLSDRRLKNQCLKVTRVRACPRFTYRPRNRTGALNGTTKAAVRNPVLEKLSTLIDIDGWVVESSHESKRYVPYGTEVRLDIIILFVHQDTYIFGYDALGDDKKLRLGTPYLMSVPYLTWLQLQ